MNLNNRPEREKTKNTDKIDKSGENKINTIQREENESVSKKEYSSGTSKNRYCCLGLESPPNDNTTIFNQDRIILLRKMLEEHLADSSLKEPRRDCQVSKHSYEASNIKFTVDDNRLEQNKKECKEENTDALCHKEESDNDTIRRKVCAVSQSFPGISSDPGWKSYNGSGSLSSQISSSLGPEVSITTLKSVKSKIKKTYKPKRNSKINLNKSSQKHRLDFVKMDEGHEKLRSHLIQNNWVQRTLSLTELNLNHLLLLVQGSSPGDNMWNEIEDNTLVSSFPRIFQQKSEGFHLRPCSEWVFSKNTAPLTYIVKGREDYLNLVNFVNNHFTKACVNLLIFTMINGTNLLSNNGTVPVWILPFALDICQEEEVESSELAAKEEFDRILTFLDYYDSLLNGNGMFKGNDDGSAQFLISMIEKIKVLLENIVPDSVKEVENNGSFFKLRQNYSEKNNSTSPNIYLIPTDTWVLKGNPGKHYGVRPFKKLRGLLMEIDTNEYECDYYIIQKHVSDQYLINNLPFKIHVYVFLQSVEPLEIVPFSRVYVIINSSTRPCVYECHKDLIYWSLEEFEAYLLSDEKENAWTDQIWPQLMTAIIQTFTHNKQFLQQRSKSFELVCISFLLDTFLKPYLINIKSNTYRFDHLPHSNHIIQKVYELIMNKLPRLNLQSTL